MALEEIVLYALLFLVAVVIYKLYNEWTEKSLDWEINQERQPFVITEKFGPMQLQELEPLGGGLYQAHFDYPFYKPVYHENELEDFPIALSHFGIARQILIEPAAKYKLLFHHDAEVRKHFESELSRITEKILNSERTYDVKEQLNLLNKIADKLNVPVKNWKEVLDERRELYGRTREAEWDVEQTERSREADVDRRAEQFARVLGKQQSKAEQ